MLSLRKQMTGEKRLEENARKIIRLSILRAIYFLKDNSC